MVRHRIDFRLDEKLESLFWKLKPKNETQKAFMNKVIKRFKEHYTKHAKSYPKYRIIYKIVYKYGRLDRQYAVLLKPDNYTEISQIEESLLDSKFPFYYAHYVREAIIYYLITEGVLKYGVDYNVFFHFSKKTKIKKIINGINKELIEIIEKNPSQMTKYTKTFFTEYKSCVV